MHNIQKTPYAEYAYGVYNFCNGVQLYTLYNC